jgi:hypothetical protein
LAAGEEGVAAEAGDLRNGSEGAAIFDGDAAGGFEDRDGGADEVGGFDAADPGITRVFEG